MRRLALLALLALTLAGCFPALPGQDGALPAITCPPGDPGPCGSEDRPAP